MKPSTLFAALGTSLLFCAANLAFAADNPTEPAKAAAPAKQATPQPKRIQAAKVKLVDINSATKAELKKLPSVTDAEADAIIAGRPYGSKAWLITRKIVSDTTFTMIRDLVVAKQNDETLRQLAAKQKQAQ